MFKLLTVLSLLFVSCSDQIDDKTTVVKDCGKVKISEGKYLKKLLIDGDRIYLLVDENENIVGGTVGTSHTVKRGKHPPKTVSSSLIYGENNE